LDQLNTINEKVTPFCSLPAKHNAVVSGYPAAFRPEQQYGFTAAIGCQALGLVRPC
jgi:hypothetical protein